MFVIFYGDGTTFSGDMDKAETVNVQAIAQDGPMGWHVASHTDFYVLRDEGFVGVDEAGYWDYMMHPGKKFVLFGRTIHTPVFQDIFQKALAFADKKRREL